LLTNFGKEIPAFVIHLSDPKRVHMRLDHRFPQHIYVSFVTLFSIGTELKSKSAVQANATVTVAT
jgi:hypothetical protein